MPSQPVPFLNPLQSGQRGSGRVRLGVMGRLETISNRFSVRIRDISVGGAHVVGARVKAGQCAVLQVYGRDIFCEAVWVRGESTGLMFQPAVEKEFVIRLRHEAPELLLREATSTEDFARGWVAGLTGEN